MSAKRPARKKTRGEKQLEIIFGVPTRMMGTIAKPLVKQIEIPHAAVPHAVEDTNYFSHAYDQID